MKKIVSCLTIIMVMVTLMTGCGNGSLGDSTGNKEGSINTGNAKVVEIGNTYSASSDIELNLVKIKTGDKLQASSGNGLYYSADSGYNFVDVIVSIKNNGGTDLSVRDCINAFFESGDGVKYKDTLIAVESSDDNINQFGSVKPLATNKVHIGYKLPSNITNGKAYFEYDGILFVVNYDANVEVSSKVTIEMNQEIVVDDVASFKLLSTKFAADVLPPNTSGFYTHYSVDDPSNYTYFVVYCDLSNESANALGADDMISVKAIFDGKYEYSANMALEATDGAGFDYANITNVKPLETRKAVFMFEVPKKVQDMNYELSIYFYGNEYSCSK